MNILIDGCVFAYSDYLEMVKFWEALIPRLVSYLEGHTIYFLNRDTEAVFPDIAVKHLFAPIPEFNRSGVEVCRLSALCKELDIDVFVSSYNTSPGLQAKSLFILGYHPSIASADCPLDSSLVKFSRQRALKMSHGYFLLSQESYKMLKSEVKIVPNEAIWTESILNKLRDWTASDVECESLAKHMAKAINELFYFEIDGNVLARVEYEEMLVCNEVKQLRKLAEEESKDEAFYPIYDPNFKPKQASVCVRFFLKGYRALIQPKRYPEYMMRVYQWIKNEFQFFSG